MPPASLIDDMARQDQTTHAEVFTTLGQPLSRLLPLPERFPGTSSPPACRVSSLTLRERSPRSLAQ